MKFLAACVRKPKTVIATIVSAVTIAASIIAGFEGKSNLAYTDMVGVPTICYGSTAGVKLGDYKTDKQCLDLLSEEVQQFSKAVDNVVVLPMSPKVHAAFTSLTYNIGITAFRNSTALKKLNAGDTLGACNEILRWNKAGGRVVQGLVNRRKAERELCLSGL